jgi:hypothetical protein
VLASIEALLETPPSVPTQFTVSSTAGIVGQEFCTAYVASKFGV